MAEAKRPLPIFPEPDTEPFWEATKRHELRYQACNDRACLPPVKLPVTAELQIAAAGAKAVAQHPNVFGKTKAK